MYIDPIRMDRRPAKKRGRNGHHEESGTMQEEVYGLAAGDVVQMDEIMTGRGDKGGRTIQKQCHTVKNCCAYLMKPPCVLTS
jgi:hypothetical protein